MSAADARVPQVLRGGVCCRSLACAPLVQGAAAGTACEGLLWLGQSPWRALACAPARWPRRRPAQSRRTGPRRSCGGSRTRSASGAAACGPRVRGITRSLTPALQRPWVLDSPAVDHRSRPRQHHLQAAGSCGTESPAPIYTVVRSFFGAAFYRAVCIQVPRSPAPCVRLHAAACAAGQRRRPAGGAGSGICAWAASGPARAHLGLSPMRAAGRMAWRSLGHTLLWSLVVKSQSLPAPGRRA